MEPCSSLSQVNHRTRRCDCTQLPPDSYQMSVHPPGYVMSARAPRRSGGAGLRRSGAPAARRWSSVTLRWADLRSLRLVSSANQRSTRFSVAVGLSWVG